MYMKLNTGDFIRHTNQLHCIWPTLSLPALLTLSGADVIVSGPAAVLLAGACQVVSESCWK